MSLFRFPVILILFLLPSCESPQEKISRLQSETLKALIPGDFFEIKTTSIHLRLPLPPEPAQAASSANRIAAIHLETSSLETEKLNAEDQKRLQQLNRQLNEMVQRGKGAFFDPTQCVLSKIRQGKTDRADIKILLKKIPEYYAEVERRWQAPNPERAKIAAAASMPALDWLAEMGDEAQPACFAVKDFIGRCQSAACLQ